MSLSQTISRYEVLSNGVGRLRETLVSILKTRVFTIEYTQKQAKRTTSLPLRRTLSDTYRT